MCSINLLGIDLGEECKMRKMKMLAAAAVVGAGLGIVATTDIAEAQDYVLSAPGCVPPPPSRMQLYYSYFRPELPLNWEPFFRHHYYRYGPILACAPIETAPVISSKY
jgi:hypothetical protein